MKKLSYLFYFFSVLLSAQVGINTTTPDGSAILDIESNAQGLLLPRMTTVQREAITSPADGLLVFDTSIPCLAIYHSGFWRCLEDTVISTAVEANCLNHFNNGSTTSGVYTIDPDDVGPIVPFQAYCDMTTDGGGWTLVLNYQHLAGSNPDLTVRTTDLPLLGSTTLGTDESSSNGVNGTWGHASNSMMASLSFTELRFYGITSAHSRIIDFKTSHASTISYFTTGTGSCTGLNTSFTTLPLHTAIIPGTLNGFFTNEGDEAMTDFPFWLSGTAHWGIKGTTTRWEVDDFPNGFGNNTFHQIWVR